MPSSSSKPEFSVQGIAASRGIAYGQAFLYLTSDVEVPLYVVDADKRQAEIDRFDQALLHTRGQLQRIRDEVEVNLGAEEARIFDAHLLVLEDQALLGETLREFNQTSHNIESCFDKVARRYIKAFDEIDDEYLRERAGDIRDVAQRLLQNLLGLTAPNLSQLLDQRVVVANEISPSDAAGLDRSQALGVVTESGSRTSHAVIVARSLNIPAVVGVRDLAQRITVEDWVLVDGYDGVVVVNPSEQTLFRYGRIRTEKQTHEEHLLARVMQPSVTRDGVAVPLRANIEKSDEVELVRRYAGQGVGLFRTEFLFLSQPRLPDEEEQYAAYRTVAEGFAEGPVILRTLDLGGDKPMSGAPDLFPEEANPFLGFRAIRFCLAHPEIFKPQLRAMLRASAHGPIELMFPMISGVDEMRRAREVLEECKRELAAAGVPHNAQVRVGSMIEIPSAALVADQLAGLCDFFSIGTNDLIQYVLAVDRVNDRIAHLYEPTHPAVVRVIRQIVEAAHGAGIKVSVCGEMAGDPVLAPLLLGLGVDELSMTPPLLPAVKYAVRALRLADARSLAERALSADNGAEILSACTAFYRELMANADSNGKPS
jgi:phosphoenolpyruvate-protein phosphotransferase (PTS system enzyme I)